MASELPRPNDEKAKNILSETAKKKKILPKNLFFALRNERTKSLPLFSSLFQQRTVCLEKQEKLKNI